jgi:hypothetical protein
MMVDSTISSGRLRDLAGLGRVRARTGRRAAAAGACAARRRTATDGAAIAGGTPPRPRPPSSRPGANDLAESTI